MKEKKIALTKDEGVKDITGYVASEDARHLIFTIPKSSVLAETLDAFKTLKKTADALGKSVAIESVDEIILTNAKAARIEASNPFFENGWKQAAEDAAEDMEDEEETDDEVSADEETEEDEDEGEYEDEQAVVATPVVSRTRRIGAAKVAPKALYRHKVRRYDDDDEESEFAVKKPRWFLKKWILVAGALVIIVPGYWVLAYVLPRASITITTHKTPWNFNNLVTVEKNGAVPARLLTEKKNAQMSFPATGKKVINQKASGKIIVYNAYSSKPQQLVATTRFATNEGLIVRLTKNVTIPGAKIENSQITPSSIEADVIADKPGPAYNIGVTKKLVIPGFKSTAKFEGFYGEIQKPLAGGFAGEAAYPTDQDIKNAKAKITDVLKESAAAQLKEKAGAEYTIVKGSEQFALVKTDVNIETNGQGEFSLFAEGEAKALAFKESDLVGWLTSKMKAELGSDYSFKSMKVAYEAPRIDLTAIKMSLPVDFQGVAERPVDVPTVRKQVLGKSEEELKKILFEVPGVESAAVTLWPGYVGRVPNSPSPEKLTFKVQ